MNKDNIIMAVIVVVAFVCILVLFITRDTVKLVHKTPPVRKTAKEEFHNPYPGQVPLIQHMSDNRKEDFHSVPKEKQ